jgi:apolipoprotein N-acyltransferase
MAVDPGGKFGTRMKALLLQLTRILLSALSGIVAAATFPPFNQDWLIWVAFIPVLSALLLFPRHWFSALFCGAVFGATFAAFLFSWLLANGRLGDWLTNVLSLSLIGGIWGFFLGLLVELPPKSTSKRLSPILPGYGFSSEGWNKSMAHLRAALIAAAGWTVLEWARGVLLPGWNAAGTVLQANLPLLQMARITGVSGLTFMAVFANVIVFATVRRLVLEPSRMTWADRFDVTATLGVIFLSALGGFWSLERRSGSETKNIALICPSGTQFGHLLELSKVAAEKGIDLFVWRCARFERGDYAAVGEVSIGKTAALLAGVTNTENGVVDGASIIVPGTVKNILVMPARRDFFVPGIPSGSRTLSPFEFNNVNWVPLLNWEAGDSLLIRSAIKGQAQVLIALIDPSLLTVPGLQQLFLNLRLWAVSLGRPLIFATVRDASAIVSASGRLVGDARSTPEADVLIGRFEIPPASERTFYGRYGDWFAIGCGVLAIFTAFSERLRRRYEKSGRLSA